VDSKSSGKRPRACRDSLKAKCAAAEAKAAELRTLTAKADDYRLAAQNAEWLKSNAAAACTTLGAANELAARFKSTQAALPEINQWTAAVRARQSELATLKKDLDGTLRAVDDADARTLRLLALLDQLNAKVAAYSNNAEKFRGLQAEIQQRLANLRSKVDHLPDVMSDPLPLIAQEQMGDWRKRLAAMEGAVPGPDFNPMPLPADVRGDVALMRQNANNLMSGLRSAANACNIDTGDDAVREADALAGGIGEALTAAADVPQKLTACLGQFVGGQATLQTLLGDDAFRRIASNGTDVSPAPPGGTATQTPSSPGDDGFRRNAAMGSM